ncbi:hypothetical protein DFS34DRAFT_212765 [Phlyctochytrium arcticum]|nr:hypothetical protein DFS34DRAFT_212765 [Phlyctochytrium arcticum]
MDATTIDQDVPPDDIPLFRAPTVLDNHDPAYIPHHPSKSFIIATASSLTSFGPQFESGGESKGSSSRRGSLLSKFVMGKDSSSKVEPAVVGGNDAGARRASVYRPALADPVVRSLLGTTTTTTSRPSSSPVSSSMPALPTHHRPESVAAALSLPDLAWLHNASDTLRRRSEMLPEEAMRAACAKAEARRVAKASTRRWWKFGRGGNKCSDDDEESDEGGKEQDKKSGTRRMTLPGLKFPRPASSTAAAAADRRVPLPADTPHIAVNDEPLTSVLVESITTPTARVVVRTTAMRKMSGSGKMARDVRGWTAAGC